MNKAFVTFLFLLFGLNLQLNAQSDSTIQGELSDFIIEQNSGYLMKYSDTKELENGLVAHFFNYRSKTDSYPYGTGFEITHPKRNTPIWYFKMNGDFGPHSLQLVDINMDDKLDLLFYLGFEDVFSTYIYTANFNDILQTNYDQSNFYKTYSNENEYSVLINLTGEKQPLILDSGYEGNVHMSGTSCFENQSGLAIMPDNKLNITSNIRKEIVQKYKELTVQLDTYNLDYNLSEFYPVFNTFILDPIKLFRINDQELKDVTSQHPEYLKWRIKILEAIQEVSSENCTPNIERTIKYLESYL